MRPLNDESLRSVVKLSKLAHCCPARLRLRQLTHIQTHQWFQLDYPRKSRIHHQLPAFAYHFHAVATHLSSDNSEWFGQKINTGWGYDNVSNISTQTGDAPSIKRRKLSSCGFPCYANLLGKTLTGQNSGRDWATHSHPAGTSRESASSSPSKAYRVERSARAYLRRTHRSGSCTTTTFSNLPATPFPKSKTHPLPLYTKLFSISTIMPTKPIKFTSRRGTSPYSSRRSDTSHNNMAAEPDQFDEHGGNVLQSKNKLHQLSNANMTSTQTQHHRQPLLHPLTHRYLRCQDAITSPERLQTSIHWDPFWQSLLCTGGPVSRTLAMNRSIRIGWLTTNIARLI